MISSRSTHSSKRFYKIALAAPKNVCYGIYKFPIVDGGEPIALAVRAHILVALVPILVGVSLSSSPTVISYRPLQVLRHLPSHPNSKCYDSS
jgi:hypothetical protein